MFFLRTPSTECAGCKTRLDSSIEKLQPRFMHDCVARRNPCVRASANCLPSISYGAMPRSGGALEPTARAPYGTRRLSRQTEARTPWRARPAASTCASRAARMTTHLPRVPCWTRGLSSARYTAMRRAGLCKTPRTALSARTPSTRTAAATRCGADAGTSSAGSVAKCTAS